MIHTGEECPAVLSVFRTNGSSEPESPEAFLAVRIALPIGIHPFSNTIQGLPRRSGRQFSACNAHGGRERHRIDHLRREDGVNDEWRVDVVLVLDVFDTPRGRAINRGRHSDFLWLPREHTLEPWPSVWIGWIVDSPGDDESGIVGSVREEASRVTVIANRVRVAPDTFRANHPLEFFRLVPAVRRGTIHQMVFGFSETNVLAWVANQNVEEINPIVQPRHVVILVREFDLRDVKHVESEIGDTSDVCDTAVHIDVALIDSARWTATPCKAILSVDFRSANRRDIASASVAVEKRLRNESEDFVFAGVDVAGTVEFLPKVASGFGEVVFQVSNFLLGHFAHQKLVQANPVGVDTEALRTEVDRLETTVLQAINGWISAQVGIANRIVDWFPSNVVLAKAISSQTGFLDACSAVEWPLAVLDDFAPVGVRDFELLFDDGLVHRLFCFFEDIVNWSAIDHGVKEFVVLGFLSN